MKKVWIFLLIAVVLIAFTMIRERFTNPNVPPTCPSGYILINQGGENTCYKETPAPPCPPGQTDMGSSCLDPDGNVPIDKCAYPYEYHSPSGKCRENVSLQCPTGYSATNTGGVVSCRSDAPVTTGSGSGSGSG